MHCGSVSRNAVGPLLETEQSLKYYNYHYTNGQVKTQQLGLIPERINETDRVITDDVQNKNITKYVCPDSFTIIWDWLKQKQF